MLCWVVKSNELLDELLKKQSPIYFNSYKKNFLLFLKDFSQTSNFRKILGVIFWGKILSTKCLAWLVAGFVQQII